MPKSILPFAGIALSISAPGQAEVVEQSETHFVTRDSAQVPAAPYDVWRKLIAPGQWWHDSHTWSGSAEAMYLSAQAGGCFCELLPEDADAPEEVRRGSALHMTVLQANPPSVLRMRGGLGPLQSEPVDGVLTITLAPADEGTRIVWEYVVAGTMRFEVPAIAEAVDGVMSQQLARLAAALGGEMPDEAVSPPDELDDEDEDEVGAGIDAMEQDEGEAVE